MGGITGGADERDGSTASIPIAMQEATCRSRRRSRRVANPGEGGASSEGPGDSSSASVGAGLRARGQKAQVTSSAAPTVMVPSTQGLPNQTMTYASPGSEPRTILASEIVYGEGSALWFASPFIVITRCVEVGPGETPVIRCVIGSSPARSTVVTSPTARSDAGTLCTSATEPAGMVGDIDPVLNMISE